MATAQATVDYAIDASHSSVGFAVRHMMLTKVRGQFRTVSGSIALAEGTANPTAIHAVIAISSIDTREEQRDAHLRSEDFLHAEKYPELTFESTNVTPVSGDRFSVAGNLTIRGVSKLVTLDAEFAGRTTDPWGNDRIAFAAKTRINRKDFGLVWHQTLETGGLIVGDDVDIDLEIEAVHAPVPATA